MKKLVSWVVCLLIGAVFNLVGFAHGVVFDIKEMDDNGIRINLKWDQEGENRGIYPIYFHIEKAKTFTIGYEIKDKVNPEPFVDFDLRKCIPPLRIVLKEVGDDAKPVFTDIKGSYAEDYIDNLHGAGIVKGMPDGSFRPYGDVTRAEFMTMLCKILKMDTNIKETGFVDIQDHWAKGVMQAGFEKGLIKGYYDNAIKPDKLISIAEACVLIDKSFVFKSAREGFYQKLQSGKWYSNSVKKIFNAGILQVEDPLYRDFEEDKFLNRSDIAMMLSRAATTF